MKKVYLIAGLLSTCLVCFLLCGCAKKKENLKGFATLIDELETIEYVTDAQGDYMFALTDAEDISEIKNLISNGDIEPVSLKSDETFEFPTGGGSIDFHGSNGASLTCFVKDYNHFKYDLVCGFYTKKTGSQIYCFNLNDDTFQKVRGIVYKGEYVHTTTKIK